MSALPSMVEQALLCSKKDDAPRVQWPANPFPRGMRDGSCTYKVHQELMRVHPRFLEHGQLRVGLNLTRGAVSWALRYLEERGFVTKVVDPRNTQYRRYRAVVSHE